MYGGVREKMRIGQQYSEQDPRTIYELRTNVPGRAIELVLWSTGLIEYQVHHPVQSSIY